MILEVVDIQIDPTKRSDFEVAVAQGIAEVISKAKGFRGYKLNAGVESPGRYILQIYWETIENHMIDFRATDAFTAWRSFVGPYFLQPPHMEHFTLASKSI